MSAEIQFLFTMALLWVGALGWGDVVLVETERFGPRLSRLPRALGVEIGQPIRVALGVALTLAFGGVAVAANVAYFNVLVAWLVLGAVVAIAYRARRLRQWRPTVLVRTHSVLVALSTGIVVLAAFGSAMTGPFNANDDDAAYLYLVQRMLSTGGLIDPFNMRRINSYGGAELFQELALRTGGNAAGLGIEWFFFTLLTVALVVGSTRRRFAPLLIVIVGLGLVIGDPVGTWANVAPTFSGAALSLALLRILILARRHRDAVVLYGLSGLLAGALLALRLEFAIPAIAAVALSALTSGTARERFRSSVFALGGAVLAIVGWAIALNESSMTFFFPLVSGTWNTSFPWSDPSIASASGYLGRIRGELGADHFAVEIGGVLIVAVTLLVARSRQPLRFPGRESAVVVGFFALGCLAGLVVETSGLSGGTLTDLGRYDAPSALAAVLFVADLLIGLAVAAPSEAGGASTAPDSDSPALRAQGPRRLAVALASATAIGLFLVAIEGSIPSYGSELTHKLRAGTSVALGREGFADRWGYQRARYAALNAAVPPHARLLAAVDVPALLDFSRFSFSTLDIVGAASPPPHLPVFAGERAVVSYLRHLGYTGIVASITDAPGLYSYEQWEKNTTSGVYDYRVMARYFLAWGKVLSGLSHDHSLHEFRVKTLDLFTWSGSAASERG